MKPNTERICDQRLEEAVSSSGGGGAFSPRLAKVGTQCVRSKDPGFAEKGVEGIMPSNSTPEGWEMVSLRRITRRLEGAGRQGAVLEGRPVPDSKDWRMRV